MAKAKGKRTARPRRASGTTELTKAQWKRVAEIRVERRRRVEAEDALQAARWEAEQCERERRKTAADRRHDEWSQTRQRATVSVEYAARLLRIPVRALLEATRGAEFRLDFGRSWTGREMTYFYEVELVRFAKAKLSGRPYVARPALAAAA